MRVLVNTRLLIKNKLDGIGWFTYETLKRITQNHPETKFYFLFDRPFSDEFIFSDNIEPIVIGPPTRHPVLWYLWFEHRLPRLIKKLKPDIFVSPDGYLSLRNKVKSLAVIHDINFLHFPQDLPFSSRWFYNYYFPKYAQKASRLATVSEYSKQDIVKNYGIEPDKIDVIYNGCNDIYRPISIERQAEVKAKYTKGNDFFIFIGSLHPRKNVANMLRAYEKFRQENTKEIHFVIVGERFFMTRDIKNAWEAMKYKNDVHFTGRMSPLEIKELLGSALALVLVSKLEGFGIPIIEAYNCGTPAIVSDVSSLPEVAGTGALYAKYDSVASIAEAMLKMAGDEQLRSRLVSNGQIVCQKFSWDKTAGLLWEGIVQVVDS